MKEVSISYLVHIFFLSSFTDSLQVKLDGVDDKCEKRTSKEKVWTV